MSMPHTHTRIAAWAVLAVSLGAVRVAHATLDNRQHIRPRKIRQQIFELDQVIRELARFRAFGQFFQLDCLLQRKFPDSEPRNFRKMRAAAELLSHLVRQRPDVRP